MDALEAVDAIWFDDGTREDGAEAEVVCGDGVECMTAAVRVRDGGWVGEADGHDGWH